MLEPIVQYDLLGPRIAAARKLKNILDDLVHTLAVIIDDLKQALVAAGELIRFAEQLAGVADGAEGVAYLVGDAGGQSAQGSELELLSLLGNQAVVFDKDQGL